MCLLLPNHLFRGVSRGMGFPGGALVKNLSANAREARDADLIPMSGRSLGVRMATRSSIFAWEIPWTEEPGGLQSMGSQKSWTHLRD